MIKTDDKKFKEIMEKLDSIIDDTMIFSPQIFRKSDRNEVRVLSYAMGISVTVGMAIGGIDRIADKESILRLNALKTEIQEIVNIVAGE